MLRILLVSTFLLTSSLQYSFGEENETEWKREIEIKEGQTIKIDDANLVLNLKEIKKLESVGCLGGLIGCPDQVILDVVHENENQQIKLAYRSGKKSVAMEAFGHRFTVIRIQEKIITLLLTH